MVSQPLDGFKPEVVECGAGLNQFYQEHCELLNLDDLGGLQVKGSLVQAKELAAGLGNHQLPCESAEKGAAMASLQVLSATPWVNGIGQNLSEPQ